MPPSVTAASPIPRDDVASRARLNLYLLCGLAMIDGVDLQLLPSTFRVLEVEFHFAPSQLATLAVVQGVAISLSGPLWGSLADNGFPRSILLGSAALAWGLNTFMLALVTNFHSMLILRALNGFASGMVLPLVQTLVADDVVRAERGKSYGCIGLAHSFGQSFAAAVITSNSEQTIWGHAGWRVLFCLVALASWIMSALAFAFLDEKPQRWTPEKIRFGEELQKFVGFCRIPTFRVLVVQGMFGCVPWAALAYSTLYFQYVGFPDWLAGTMYGVMMIGTASGQLLGGYIGDKLATWSANHGRALTAQISVFNGIPICVLLFGILPREATNTLCCFALCFSLGIGCSWCSTGCKSPIFVDIVPEQCRSSVWAWDSCLERTFATFVGPATVSYLAEQKFGYRPQYELVTDMLPAERITNADALGRSILWCTIVPWTVCLFFWSFLHFTYEHDATEAISKFSLDLEKPSETSPMLKKVGTAWQERTDN